MSGEHVDDRSLVERAKQSDGAALGELFTRYWRAARAVAFGVTGDLALAEDAAAEAFRHVLAGIVHLRETDRFGPWLRTVVVRQARRLRRRVRDVRVDDGVGMPEAGDERAGPEAALLRLELAALLRQAAADLPERLREAVTLVYFEGFEPDAAAGFLGIPHGTLRRRLHNGRERMRRTIAEGMTTTRRVAMNEKREHQVRELLDLIDRGAMLRAFPPMAARDAGAIAEVVSQALLRGADEPDQAATDAVAAAVRRALPEFEEWRFDVAATARWFFLAGDAAERRRAAAPPGFAEGRPGAFLRVTRALVRADDGDAVAGSMYEQARDHEDLREAMSGMRLCDAIDLTWTGSGGAAVDLRAVQTLLERVAAAVLPGTALRFSPYEEPRYRTALQMETEGATGRAACGGVLAMEYVEGAAVAHARIYLNSWASARGAARRPGTLTSPSAER